MKFRGVELTRHAVQRYLLRIKGMNEKDSIRESVEIEKYAPEIVPESVANRIAKFGDGRYDTKTHSLIVAGKVIPTVIALHHLKDEVYHWRKSEHLPRIEKDW